MNYYTYSVVKNTQDGKDVFDVVETPVNGEHPAVISVCEHEVDAMANAFYFNAYEKHHDHHLASLATCKWLAENGLKTINTHIQFFDKVAGTVDVDKAFNAIWRSL